MEIDRYSPEIRKLIRDFQEKRIKGNRKSMTAAKRLYSAAKKQTDPDLIGYGHFAIADISNMWGTEFSSMMNHLIKAVECFQAAEDYGMLGRTYNLLGINALRSGDRMQALDHFLLALDYAEKTDSGIIPGLICCNMGSIYMEIADYGRATRYFRNGLKILKRFKEDPMYYRNMAILCNKLGISYVQYGKLSQAERVLTLGEKIIEEDPEQSLFPGHYVVLMLKLYLTGAKGEKEEENRVIEELLSLLTEYKISTDSLEDVLDFAHFLEKEGKSSELKRVLELLGSHLEEFQITIQKIDIMELKVAYLRMAGDEEGLRRTLEEVFRLNLQYKKEQQKASVMNLKMRERMEELRKRQEKIQAENERLMHQASFDELTGLPNRYDLNSYADKAFSRAARNQHSLAVEILDIDYFKQYNDTYGHQEGDRCLQRIAELIRILCQENLGVYAARYGGDEFVIIYENFSDDEVTKMAESLRDRVLELKMENIGAEEGKYITISQGIRNSVPVEGNKLWDFMYAADNALYDIKQHNKGEVELIHKAQISKQSLRDARRSIK